MAHSTANCLPTTEQRTLLSLCGIPTAAPHLRYRLELVCCGTTVCLCAWLWALQRRAPAMAEGGNSDVISVNAPAGSAESVWLTELAQLGISVGEVGATASL